MPLERGKIKASSDAFVPNTPHVFAGGDAVTGPATVIRAVAAGKVAAANIDAHLGSIMSSSLMLKSRRPT